MFDMKYQVHDNYFRVTINQKTLFLFLSLYPFMCKSNQNFQIVHISCKEFETTESASSLSKVLLIYLINYQHTIHVSGDL